MSQDLLITIDLAAAAPVYRQIVDAIRVHLVDGRLAPGEQLPTVRRLAGELGVHHNTVAGAYRELAEEGWLDLGRRRGATVLKKTRAPAAKAGVLEQYRRRLTELLAQARADGLPETAIRKMLNELMDQR